MNSRALGTAVVMAVFAMGARDTGCLGLQEPRAPIACPAIACDPSCSNGTKVDANGCPTCECSEQQGCASDQDCQADEECVQVTCVTAPCNPVCQKKTKPSTACWEDKECGAGQICDRKNYCESPPGCDPAQDGCPPVCYGRCVDTQVNECSGVYFDAAGNCLTKDGKRPPEYCCKEPPPPPKCGDGSVTACDAIPPKCEAPYVAGEWKGCWACFEPNTCFRQCSTDSECDNGLKCVADPSDLCNNPAADCFRAGHHFCAAEACDTPACDMYCEFGYELDPATGCALCKCKVNPVCGCTEEYLPVCGSDGKTYGNKCEAACANATVVSSGECSQCTVTCQRETLVCGEDGVTYRCGEPDALCHNTRVAYAGACKVDCSSSCAMTDPVCGDDGHTYQCAGEAKCRGVYNVKPGACGGSQNCNIQCLVYEPVCGTNGVTYGCGEVEAKCSGVAVLHAGECGAICKADSDCKMGETCFISVVARRMYGECQPVGYCELPDDCLRYNQPVPACVGKWECLKNQCQYNCGP